MNMRTILSCVLSLGFIASVAPAAELPRPAKDFRFRLPGGQEVSLGQYKGKVIALEFLLTTCPHCQDTSRVMQKLYQELGPKGVQALGVSINDPDGRLTAQYIKQFGLSYPVGYQPNRDAVSDFLQHPIMVTMMMPQLVLIDRNGVIRAQYGGSDPFFNKANEEQNLRKALLDLLKTAPAKKGTAKKKPS
jgi:peroxiredoxin